MQVLLFYELIDEVCYFQLATIQSLSTHFRACRLLSSKNFCNVVFLQRVKGVVWWLIVSHRTSYEKKKKEEKRTGRMWAAKELCVNASSRAAQLLTKTTKRKRVWRRTER